MTSRPNSLKFVRRNIEGAIDLTQRRKWYTDPPTPPAGDPPAPPPAPADEDEKPTITQTHMGKVQANTRKEAIAAERKRLLEAFGVDPNDEKAVDTVKGLIAAAKDAEKAKLSVEQQKQLEIDALIKERDEAKLAADNIKQERLLELRDNGIKAALSDPKLHCKNADKVFKLLKADHESKFADVLKEDGTLDADKVKALVELGRKDNPEYFTGGGPSIPSNMGNGRPSDPNATAAKHASYQNQQRIRG